RRGAAGGDGRPRGPRLVGVLPQGPGAPLPPGRGAGAGDAGGAAVGVIGVQPGRAWQCRDQGGCIGARVCYAYPGYALQPAHELELLMAYTNHYLEAEPSRAEVDAREGPLLLEFGAPWCPQCQGAQPSIEALASEHPQLQHLKIEDGRGKPLGRSFKVKLWPTLVL